MSQGDTCLLPWRLSGTEVARARFGRWHETWEPLAVMMPVGVLTPGGGRENPKQLICEGESTDARQGGGPPRSSCEGPVMGLEPRGRVVRVRLVVNWDCSVGAR
jgi:hypothetical protein